MEQELRRRVLELERQVADLERWRATARGVMIVLGFFGGMVAAGIVRAVLG